MKPDFLLKTRRQAIARARRKYHQKDFQGALSEWDELLARNGDDSLALLGRFDCLLKLGEKDELVAIGEAVCEANPASQAAHNNFACVLLERREYARAAQYFNRVIDMDDGRPMYFFNAGLAYRGAGEPDKAATCFARVLEKEPEHQRALEFLSQIYLDAGMHQRATELAMRLRLLRPGYTPALERRTYARWADDAVDDSERSREAAILRNALPRSDSMLPDGRLSVGWLVCPHGLAILRYLMPLLLRTRDPERIEMIGFTNDTVLGAPALQGMFDRVVSCDSPHPDRMRGLLAVNPVDVLVDIAGLVPNGFNLYFGRRLAPRQVAWPLTYSRSELVLADVSLVDDVMVRPDEINDIAPSSLGPRSLSGHVRRLDSLFCYPEPADSPEPGASPALDRGYVTFGINAEPGRINRFTLGIWSDLLRRIETARICFLSPGMSPALAQQVIREQLVANGIEPERVSFREATDFKNRFQSYTDVDIVLNPVPFGETLSLADAMWMGCPVLGMADERHISRMSNSVMTASGHGHWLYPDRSGLIEAAAAMAADPAMLTQYRGKLREELRQSPLMDCTRWANILLEQLCD